VTFIAGEWGKNTFQAPIDNGKHRVGVFSMREREFMNSLREKERLFSLSQPGEGETAVSRERGTLSSSSVMGDSEASFYPSRKDISPRDTRGIGDFLIMFLGKISHFLLRPRTGMQGRRNPIYFRRNWASGKKYTKNNGGALLLVTSKKKSPWVRRHGKASRRKGSIRIWQEEKKEVSIIRRVTKGGGGLV